MLTACLIGALSVPDIAHARSHSFVDDDDSVFEQDIEWIAARGITKGCNPPSNTRFCPDDPVSREQMATFLMRATSLRPSGRNMFGDDNDSVHESAINAIARAGITVGCNPPANNRFCPGDNVTRGQMAAFLTRAFSLGRTYSSFFGDDNYSVFESDINRIASADVTRGCNPPDNDRFCPDRVVTRGEIAAFLRRAMSGARTSNSSTLARLPLRNTVEYSAGKVLTIDVPTNGRAPLVGGVDLNVSGRRAGSLHRLSADGRSLTRTYSVENVHDAISVGDDVVTGDGGRLERWASVTRRLWRTRIGGTVHAIELASTGRHVFVGSSGPDPLVVVRLSDGAIVARARMTGAVNGADLSADGRRLVVIGRQMVINGDRSRRHIAVFNVDGTSLSLSGWNSVRANRSCQRTVSGDPTSPGSSSLAYIRDVEWAPAAAPGSIRNSFVIATTGAHRDPNKGHCDSIVRFDGYSNSSRVTPIWVSRAQLDSATSVGWSPDGANILVGGHFKQIEWIPGGVDEYGRDRRDPFIGDEFEGTRAQRDRARTNRMGLAMINTGDGTLTGWRSDKCRAYGAEAIVWTRTGAWIGYDCHFWGNDESKYLYERERERIPRDRLAFLPETVVSNPWW